MTQEQIPTRVSTPESTPLSTLTSSNPVIPQSIEGVARPPLVPEADLKRMEAQIAEVFKNSTHIPEKSGEWKAETGMGEQAANIAWFGLNFGLKHPLLVGKGLFHLFKNNKSHPQAKSTQNRTQDA
jgi:hypothetical protein